MRGYYNEGQEADGKKIPAGRLNIEVRNMPEFNALLEQAEKEARQLNKTVNELRNFMLSIDFSVVEQEEITSGS